MLKNQVFQVSSILLYLALIATYSVAYIRDKEIRDFDNMYDQGYVNGLSATVMGSHIIGGLLILLYYNRKNTLFLSVASILFTISFFLNLKLLEVPYDVNGVKTMQIDWLSQEYPVVWRLSSFILAILYYYALFTILLDKEIRNKSVRK